MEKSFNGVKNMKKIFTGLFIIVCLLFTTSLTFACENCGKDCDCGDNCKCKKEHICDKDCDCGCKDGKECTCRKKGCPIETCKCHKKFLGIFKRKCKCNSDCDCGCSKTEE